MAMTIHMKAEAINGAVGHHGTGNRREATSSFDIWRRIWISDIKMATHTHSVANDAMDIMMINVFSGIL